MSGFHELVDDLTGHPLATVFEASPEAVERVLGAPEGNDGRSGWSWLRLNNGDLALVVFPTGDGYFDVELLVEADWVKAEANSPPEVCDNCGKAEVLIMNAAGRFCDGPCADAYVLS